MTQETPSAGDSAPEKITLVDPVTGEQTTADIDDMPDHGIITMDLGGFAPKPEPYRRTYRVTMDLTDGTRILIEDAADGQTFVSAIADEGAALSLHLTGDENDRFRSALMNTQYAAADKRRG
jgi:hypothetical protein